MFLDPSIKDTGFVPFAVKAFMEKRKKASPNLDLPEVDEVGRKELMVRQISYRCKYFPWITRIFSNTNVSHSPLFSAPRG